MRTDGGRDIDHDGIGPTGFFIIMAGSGALAVILAGVSAYVVEIPHLEKITGGFYAFWLAYLVGARWRAR